PRAGGQNPPMGAPTRLWPRVGGPLLTLLTLAALLALRGTPWRLPNPGLVFLIPVVFSAYSGGLGPGLVSAAACLVFTAFYLSDPGRPLHWSGENLGRLAGVTIATPIIAVMVGALKRRELRRITARESSRAGERYRDLVDDIDGVVWE